MKYSIIEIQQAETDADDNKEWSSQQDHWLSGTMGQEVIWHNIWIVGLRRGVFSKHMWFFLGGFVPFSCQFEHLIVNTPTIVVTSRAHCQCQVAFFSTHRTILGIRVNLKRKFLWRDGGRGIGANETHFDPCWNEIISYPFFSFFSLLWNSTFIGLGELGSFPNKNLSMFEDFCGPLLT